MQIQQYLMALLVVSGSWAETLPMELPTLASSETNILLSGVEKTGGSFTSSTVTLTDVVSLNGPKLKKLESIFLFVASILREKPLFVSKSRGWRRETRENTWTCLRGVHFSCQNERHGVWGEREKCAVLCCKDNSATSHFQSSKGTAYVICKAFIQCWDIDPN